jgi:hypothetical protein
MRSTMASAAARPAAIWSWPGWPSTTPVIVVRLPSIQRSFAREHVDLSLIAEESR